MASIAKRPDGRWRARYRDAAGKEHARHFRRKVDAQQWLDEVTASVVTGRYVDPSAGRVTFGAFFTEWTERQVWEQGTRETAETAVVNLPFWDMKMKDVRPMHVEGWVKSMSSRELKATTVRTRASFIQKAFRAAVKNKIITESPAEDLQLPKLRRQEAAMTVPTPEQVHLLLGEWPETEGMEDMTPLMVRTYMAVCAFAGLRLGEASGLQLGDVDFLRRTIRVQRQVQGKNKADTRLAAPKAGSERVVFVPAELMDLLALYVRQVGTYGPEQWLFQTGGALWHRGIAGHHFRQARKRVEGMEDFTLHDLRHFYASGLIAAGCDVVTVQRSLGHSKPSITLNTYAHLWPTAEDRTRSAAAGLMEQVFRAGADSVRTKDGDAASDLG